MKWKLVLQLSLLGLAMAIGTVFVIPSNVEPLLWPAIFIACALVIARRAPRRFFLHGFFVGLANWTWVAIAHVVFFDAYAAHHAEHLAALQSLPVPDMPLIASIVEAFRQYALPIPGLSGIVIGSLAWIVSKLAAPKRRTAA
jgi:hypothetical protein